MATAESVKAKIQGLIDTANAATGNTDTDLTTAVNALVEGFGQGGSSGSDSGSMETGEFTGVQGSLNIPVSSKKTHLVVYPKNVADENGLSARVSYLFANEANFQFTAGHTGGNTQFHTGEDVTVTFTDTNISFNFWGIGMPCNTIEFYWFAW